MTKLFIAVLLALSFNLTAQTITEKPKILYGLCNKDSLLKEPFNKWYTPGYESYQPNATTVAALKKINADNITIEVFFGSWCGDSKREVPKFLKFMNEISFPDKKIKLIGLGASDSLYKQSPQQEEKNKGIFRVPVFIIYKNGIEINRINEFPAFSLEKDLLAIFSNQPYTPNYQSFAFVHKWLNDGTFTDDNITAASLAQQIRLSVKDEHELNSLGYLLLKQDKKKEAVRIFQINAYLYPESANVISSLGEGYVENGDYKKAVSTLERALELNKIPADVKGILEILYKAKEKEKK